MAATGDRTETPNTAATRGDRVARRNALLAVYTSVPAAILAFWWFRQEGWVADTPYWILVTLLVVTGMFNMASIFWLRGRPDDPVRIQVRLFVSTMATTAVVYAIGWGPMLVIGYGVGF